MCSKTEATVDPVSCIFERVLQFPRLLCNKVPRYMHDLLGVAARCERLLLSPTVLDTTCVMNCLWHLCVLLHSVFWALQVIVLVSPLRVRRANLLSAIGEEGGRQGCGSGSRTRQKSYAVP